jgi:hypothetical protein
MTVKLCAVILFGGKICDVLRTTGSFNSIRGDLIAASPLRLFFEPDPV